MNWVEQIPSLPPFKVYSQWGEEGVIRHIVDSLGMGYGGTLLDLGAGDGYALSNSRWLIEERGWNGTLIDGDPRGSTLVTKAWIDLETIDDLLPVHADAIMIDIDGNDYWILERVLGLLAPKFFVCEINPDLPRYPATVMPYNAEHRFDRTDGYGASLGAFELLGKRFGYTLIHLHHAINAFFVRNDLLPGPAPTIHHDNNHRSWAKNTKTQWEQVQ